MSQGEQPRIHHSEDNGDSRIGCGWIIFLAFLIVGIVCYCYRSEIQERLKESNGMDDMDSMNLSLFSPAPHPAEQVGESVEVLL